LADVLPRTSPRSSLPPEQSTCSRNQRTQKSTHSDPKNAQSRAKNTLPFTVVDLGKGRFRVEMPQDLAPGEYGFVLLGERKSRGGTLFRIYDFEVAAAGK